MKKAEWSLYVETLREIINRHYEKEMVFYDDLGRWYSRYHSDYITPDQLAEFVLELTDDSRATEEEMFESMG